MICSNCGQENQSSTKFCMACGTPIAPAIVATEPGNKKPSPNWLKIGGIGCGGLIALFVMLAIVSTIYTKNVMKELDKADNLWKSGDKKAAVEIYKKRLDMTLTGHEDRTSMMYERVIEFELENGNHSAARMYIENALDKKVDLSLDSKEGKKLLAEVKEERAKKEREKKEEKERREAAKKVEKESANNPEQSKQRKPNHKDNGISTRDESVASSDSDKKENKGNKKCKGKEVYDMYTKETKCVKSEKREVESDQNAEKPSIKVSAVQLFNEYKSNEVAADKKYRDKIIEVTGTVVEIGKDMLSDEPNVKLAVGQNDMGLSDVTCTFRSKHTDELAALSKGQDITVRGKGAGFILGVSVAIHYCEVVN